MRCHREKGGIPFNEWLCQNFVARVWLQKDGPDSRVSAQKIKIAMMNIVAVASKLQLAPQPALTPLR
jgi:hypothetical protein